MFRNPLRAGSLFCLLPLSCLSTPSLSHRQTPETLKAELPIQTAQQFRT